MAQGSSLGPKDYEKRSKLSQAKGVGSSYRGSHEWLVSRIQAVLSVPFSLYVLFALITGNANTYYQWVDWLGNPFNMACLFLAILTLSWHGAYGLITVINDYVHNTGINFFAVLSVRMFFGCIVVFSTTSILLTIF